MNRHEELMERYEDALFAVLMEGVAEKEGEEALMWLKQEPDFEVPEATKVRCTKTIRATFARKKRAHFCKSARHTFQKVSVIVVLMLMLFTVAFATFEPVRRCVFNAIISVEEKYTELHFSESPSTMTYPTGSGIKVGRYALLGFIPEDYEIIGQHELEDGSGSISFIKSKDENAYLKVRIYTISESTVYQFDTENGIVQEVLVQGYLARLVTKEVSALGDSAINTKKSLTWIDDEKGVIVSIVGNNLTSENIIKIGQNIAIV